jgi:hypothetical protein
MRSIATDRGLVERLGQGAMEFAAPFTWDRAADETEAHLRSVVDAAAPGGPGTRG